MPGETSAQINAMNEAARHVDNAGQALAVIRGNIQQSIDSTAAGYNSPAATLFRNTMSQWGDDFQKIIGGLERIRTALTHNTKHYEATMEQERHSANQIAALLNSPDGGI
jgi:WXG100 family type VII secretion target